MMENKENTNRLTTLDSMLLEFFLNHNPDPRTMDINQNLLDSKIKQRAAKDKMQDIVDKQK